MAPLLSPASDALPRAKPVKMGSARVTARRSAAPPDSCWMRNRKIVLHVLQGTSPIHLLALLALPVHTARMMAATAPLAMLAPTVREVPRHVPRAPELPQAPHRAQPTCARKGPTLVRGGHVSPAPPVRLPTYLAPRRRLRAPLVRWGPSRPRRGLPSARHAIWAFSRTDRALPHAPHALRGGSPLLGARSTARNAPRARSPTCRLRPPASPVMWGITARVPVRPRCLPAWCVRRESTVHCQVSRIARTAPRDCTGRWWGRRCPTCA
mmetsp:Transcript_74753/g.200345  ORF Transcript_74753/g.200345 Transcript_74753/m.200345 type:complete len:267 (+) Transcript_74753:805-1605(+)